eukprot:Skav228665  [mRNA]  locus=scaffold1332:11769:14931:- [translate_table: standard]
MSHLTNVCNAVWACAKADVEAKELIDYAINFMSKAGEPIPRAQKAFPVRYYIMVVGKLKLIGGATIWYNQRADTTTSQVVAAKRAVCF